MRKLKVAVIGVGFWGRNHARIFSELRQTELVAVCDVEKERAVNIAKKYGVDAYTDSRKLVENKEVDALSICTWTTTHAKEASVALKAGKHLLVEKPIASTVDEAKRIVELARKKQRILMVGFIERFNPSVQRVRKELSKSSIGTVVSATARRVSRWPERIGDVGIVKDTAIHDIDVMRHLFSEDPVYVYANTGNLKHTKYDDYAQIVLTFKNGKTAFIETNWLTPNKVRKLIVTGSEGIITIDYLTQEVKIETAAQTLTPKYSWNEPLKLELQHFADRTLENETPIVTGVDGLKALIIAEAVLESSSENRIINLESRLEKA